MYVGSGGLCMALDVCVVCLMAFLSVSPCPCVLHSHTQPPLLAGEQAGEGKVAPVSKREAGLKGPFICSQKPFHLPDKKQHTKQWLPPSLPPSFPYSRAAPPSSQGNEKGPLRSPHATLLGSQGLRGTTQL